MATTTKVESSPVGSSVSGLDLHVEELHAFFKTRGIEFGSAEDLTPFVDRLDSDASFADEMASMVRTIIYRERDGLSRLELMEMLVGAVGGPGVEDATAPEVREAVRRLMGFVESVFRTRRNPGAVQVAVVKPEHQEHKEPEVPAVAVAQEAVTAEVAESPQVEHPTIDMFYRARMIEENEGSVAPVDERKAKDEAAEPVVLYTDLPLRVPFEDFEDRATERGSRAWLWVAGFCALLLAFCAGLFVHQRLIVPLRAPNTPYEKLPPETQEAVSPAPAAVSGAQQAAAEGAATGSPETSAPVIKPSAASVPVNDVTQRPRYMAPATIGAPPAVMASRLVYAPPPAYPMMAEMTRTQGKVTVEAVVGKDGRVIRAQAIGGHRLLRGAAVREVFGRRYRPFTVNARPMDVATLVTVDFRLKR